jgi:mannose-6-phosphate isomerase-like protein (cupin superfamily)
MQIARTLTIVTIAFVAGGFAARMLPVASAQAPAPAALTPQIIDITALEGEAIGPIQPNTDIRSKTLVVTDKATIAVQQGNVGKHYHAGSDEIQYILSGTGTAWLGDKQVPLKAGDLLIVPKGVNHGGTVATSGTFKAIAIKIPPQAAGDVHFVQ